MSPVFAHGQLRLYLLTVLADGPKHGYEIIRDLEQRFEGLYVPSAGTIYPRLARLEEDGLVAREDEGRKAVYRITPAGAAEVARRREEVQDLELDLERTVSRLAEHVREQVRGGAQSLRSELKAAARHARRHARDEPLDQPLPGTRQPQIDLAIDELRRRLRGVSRRGWVDQQSIDEIVGIIGRARDDVQAVVSRAVDDHRRRRS